MLSCVSLEILKYVLRSTKTKMKLKTVVPPIDNNRSQQWSGMYVFSREAKDHIPRCGTRWLTVGSLSLLQNLPSRASLAFNNCLAQNTGSGVCDFGGETGGGGSRRKRERVGIRSPLLILFLCIRPSLFPSFA